MGPCWQRGVFAETAASAWQALGVRGPEMPSPRPLGPSNAVSRQAPVVRGSRMLGSLRSIMIGAPAGALGHAMLALASSAPLRSWHREGTLGASPLW